MTDTAIEICEGCGGRTGEARIFRQSRLCPCCYRQAERPDPRDPRTTEPKPSSPWLIMGGIFAGVAVLVIGTMVIWSLVSDSRQHAAMDVKIKQFDQAAAKAEREVNRWRPIADLAAKGNAANAAGRGDEARAYWAEADRLKQQMESEDATARAIEQGVRKAQEPKP